MAAVALRERMRVGVHVGQLLQPIPGGIGRVTEMLCRELPKHADIVAFTAVPGRDRRAFGSRFDPAVEVRRVGPGAPRWHYELWQRYRGHPVDLDLDVCHAPSLAIPPSAAPLVVTVNDLAFLRHPETFTRHGIRFHQRGLAIARREAAAIIVPSEFSRAELVREGFDERRIHCVPLAAPLEPKENISPPALVRGLQARGVRAPYLLVAGTVEPRKDHRAVVAAFERLRRDHADLTLVVAGPPGWLGRPVGRELARPGIVGLGSVSDPELDVLYRGAAIVVNASIYEGFGLTVLEAMSRGCAVVASGIPAHVELVADAARLFPPGRVTALAAEIDRLLRDPFARDDLGRAALARSRSFTVEATIAGHLAVYARVASGSRAADR